MMPQSFTSADELFCEIRDLDGVILEIIALPIASSWHWPSYYLLLVEADRLSWLLGDAAGNLACHMGRFGEPWTQAEAVNDGFAHVGQRVSAMVRWLRRISRDLPIENSRLRERLRAHVQPKSAWCQTFEEDYNPGRIDSEGRLLERTVLVFDPHATRRITDDGRLVRVQRFDLSTEQARAEVHAAALAAARAHARTLAAMTAFFLEHCTIEALAHPSSA